MLCVRQSQRATIHPHSAGMLQAYAPSQQQDLPCILSTHTTEQAGECLLCCAVLCCSLGGDVAVNSGSTAQVIEPDLKAGAATFNVVDNLLLPPDELSSVSFLDMIFARLIQQQFIQHQPTSGTSWIGSSSARHPSQSWTTRVPSPTLIPPACASLCP